MVFCKKLGKYLILLINLLSHFINRPLTGITGKGIENLANTSVEKIVRTGKIGNNVRTMTAAFDKRTKIETVCFLII